jgi:hypothetical protein
VEARTVCWCFGYTADDLDGELVARIRKRIAEEGCDCKAKNPAGVCCLPTVEAELSAAGQRQRARRSRLRSA